MKLVSVNIGQPKDLSFDGRTVRTAILKSPVEHKVQVGELGVQGDCQVDQEHHGGIHQAVYAYFQSAYDYWRASLGKSFPFGSFGENLTIDGLNDEATWIGDVFQIGSVVFQVSQPRSPCYKLNIAMRDRQFSDRFLQSRKLGAYLRVLESGELSPGDQVDRIARGEGGVSIAEVCRVRYFDKNDVEGIAKCADIPALSPDWKTYFRNQLANR